MKFCNKCGTSLLLNENWSEARKHHHMNICNKCNNEKAKVWRDNNKEKSALINKNSNLKRKYNITLKEYDLLLINSNHSCEICGKHESEQKKSLHVDHSHITGRVRGILCSNCNTALGKFREDKDILLKAINYLKKHNED